MSIFSQAKALTRRFVVEFGQKSDFPNQSFSIKRAPHTFSDIVDTNGYAGSDSLADKKRHSVCNYGVKTTIIESSSWQWLYATHLLVGYEFIPTTKDTPFGSLLYSWLPVEVVAVVARLLKSYWKPNSPLFFSIEPQKVTSMLTKRGYPFAITTMMHGSGGSSLQYPTSQSSGHQASAATTHSSSSFTSLLYSDSGSGNGDTEQYSHTLGLNCFIHPCYGVCQLRPSGATSRQSSRSHSVNEHCLSSINHFDFGNATHSMSAEPACANALEGRFNDDVQVPGKLSANADDWVIIDGLLSLSNHCLPEENGISCTAPNLTDPTETPFSGCLPSGGAAHHQQALTNQRDYIAQKTCDMTVVGKDGQQQSCGKVCRSIKALSDHKGKIHSGQQTCGVTIVREDSQQQPCGTVCKNVQALLNHKRIAHSGQQTCEVKVVAENGQLLPCGKVCKNTIALVSHRRRTHSGQRVCGVTLVGEGGRKRPCGWVCQSAQALSQHKSGYHSGQKTCNAMVVGENGQQRPCGTFFRNARALLNHKRRCHTGKKVCDVTVVGEDGQPWPCGKLSKNALALSVHKSKAHSGQKTCEVTMVGEDGQLRPCGKLCKNAGSLTDHKRRHHSEPQTCEMTVVAEDGQSRPCGKACISARALSSHKRVEHTVQQACDEIVIGEDGQQRPCGRICKNAESVSEHKRKHRKRKPADLNQSDDPGP
ncbi:hypothetical protein [Endozoicomonas sp. ONNA1]|uniref:hypothetical protein n=1 Tax=Endozoicomonas sp. ONNA1 TaxID=2828740 RepID=UPI0021492C94|nr:hypothetical protein [Endozoicomonas sp. ONNA1]